MFGANRSRVYTVYHRVTGCFVVVSDRRSTEGSSRLPRFVAILLLSNFATVLSLTGPSFSSPLRSGLMSSLAIAALLATPQLFRSMQYGAVPSAD